MPAVARIVISAITWWLLLTPTAQAADVTLFRLFLTDGSTLVSFGEYARVARIGAIGMQGDLDQAMQLYVEGQNAWGVDKSSGTDPAKARSVIPRRRELHTVSA